MSQSCRDVILDVWKDDGIPIGTNGGLLRDRYLRLSVKDDEHKDARDELHGAIREAVVHSLDVYRLAFANNSFTIQMPKDEGIFLTSGRMIVGLGGENVLETGITLQHTYGTPVIPGSALKGLAAHYCDQVWGASDSKFKLGGNYHETIFGTSEDSGHIIFYDAWITPESLSDALKPDVMTPHHSDYYSNKDDAAPTDFDSPIPVTFLSVAGSFHIAVSCDVQNDDGEKWAKLAFKMLAEALKEWGIGGKTNAGYGRLVKPNERSSTEPQVRRPRYKKGAEIEVTREADPKQRNRAYFKADDGFGGFVQYDEAPPLDIGQKTSLEITGVMDEGYVFVVPGSRDGHIRKKGKKGRRGRR